MPFIRVYFGDAGEAHVNDCKKISRLQKFYSGSLSCQLQVRGWLQGKCPGLTHPMDFSLFRGSEALLEGQI